MEGYKDRTALRCTPGGFAQIIHSTNPLLIGRTVFVEKWSVYERWDVTVLGEPIFGIEFATGRPVISNKLRFRDSSLEPINTDGSLLGSGLIAVDARIPSR